jgi:hypothetical protein
MLKQSRDLAFNHVREALVGAIAEAFGCETLSRHLHAQTKLRLISMSDEDLRELAKLLACPPERTAEMAYQELRDDIKQIKQMAHECTKDLPQNSVLSPEEETLSRIVLVKNEPSLRKDLVSAITQAGFIIDEVLDSSQAIL